VLALLLLGAMAAACTGVPGGDAASAGRVASDVDRVAAPEVTADETARLVAGHTAFAFDLLQAVRREPGNLFFSPFSVSFALAMTSAGARGNTLRQMEDVLQFGLEQEALHRAANALDQELQARDRESDETQDHGFALRLVNSTWGQIGYEFLPGFLDLLAANYGAGMRLVDYAGDPEAARREINTWVSERTEGRIEELLPQGMVTADDRLTLVNAVYFLAPWESPFPEELTADAPFHLVDGTQASVPTMQQVEYFRYAEGDGYRAVELPYDGGDLAMLLLAPDEGALERVESSLSLASLDELVGRLDERRVALWLPRFRVEWGEELSAILYAMGMTDAFDPAAADFSGMDGTRNLSIGFVMHKAFVSVDEEGTEAAAATAVGMRLGGAPEPPIELRFDRPFLFLIRDLPTGAVLFVGRVADPR